MNGSAEDIFSRLAHLRPDEREEMLRRECGQSAELRAEVERLLRMVDHDSVRFLEQPLVIGHRGVATPPSRIGRYRILGKLGEGASGVVLEAEQTDPTRRVAIKLLSTAFVGPTEATRFRFEAEVLARLQHPGIAQVFECGTYEGALAEQPYIAMELVVGERLDRYVDAHALDVADRLRLMLSIFDAVDYAHRQGVIHRDLKPANVMITEGARPKLLDFGIARFTDVGGSTPTLPATRGPSGTLPYMSPEQVSREPGPVDTRTDVYALGVMLYQLLGGRLPLDLSELSLPEAARAIVEREPVPLGQLDPALRGDVATIVATAMAKEPGQRYGTVAAFGDDIRRHLADQPIQARPATVWYVVRKFARRHRAVVAVSCGAVLALVTGIIGTAWNAVEANAQAESAVRRLDLARDSLDFLFREVIDELPAYAGTSGLQARILDRGTRYYQSLADENPHSLAERRPLALAYSQLAFVELNRGDLVSARAAAERFDQLIAALARDFGPSPSLRLDALRAEFLLCRLGGDHRRPRLLELAEVVVADAPDEPAILALAVQAFTFEIPNPGSPEFERAAALCDHLSKVDPGNVVAIGHGSLLDERRCAQLIAEGRLPEACQLRRRAVASLAGLLADNPTNPGCLNNVSWLRASLAELEAELGDRDSAVRHVRESLTGARDLVRLDPSSRRFRETLLEVLRVQIHLLDGDGASERYDAHSEASEHLIWLAAEPRHAESCIENWLSAVAAGHACQRSDDVAALRARAIDAVREGRLPRSVLAATARAELGRTPSAERRQFLADLIAALATTEAAQSSLAELQDLESSLRRSSG